MSDLRKLIRAVESDNNPAAVHPTIKTGIQRGTHAMGAMGLMPNTAQMMARRKVRDGVASPLDQAIADADPKAIEEMLKDNPGKYDSYAQEALGDAARPSNGDPMDSYFRYNFGAQSDPDAIKQHMTDNPELMQRVEDKIREQHMSSEPDKYTDSLAIPEKEVLYSKTRKMLGK